MKIIFAFRTRLYCFHNKYFSICYAVVNLLSSFSTERGSRQKALSLRDSLNIIPFTADKVKRFFKYFEFFSNFFDFFYFFRFYLFLFVRSKMLLLYIILCRAREEKIRAV